MDLTSLAPIGWLRGLMDKASDFESEDCGFESHRGLQFFYKSIYFARIDAEVRLWCFIINELSCITDSILFAFYHRDNVVYII